MARILPDGWRELKALGAAQREIATLALFEQALPEGYTVYHGVHWTKLQSGFSVHERIDFVVVNRAGSMLLIEQRSGLLRETPQGLVKPQDSEEEPLPVRLMRTAQVFRQRLSQRPGTEALLIEALLYCPDYRVEHPETAGLIPERIVDAARRDQLVPTVISILPESEDHPAARQVHRFLSDILDLYPDTSALIGRAQALVTRLSGGLAQWARQIHVDPWRLRVIGTAGSGKSQLALAQYRDAIRLGRRPLYVCFNRPLADHFAAIAPEGGLACTFHMLCERRVREAGHRPDFSQPDVFERMAEQARASEVAGSLRFDTVIIDEGQDFHPQWAELVLAHAREDARILWLEDPMQNLYGRAPVRFPGWVELHTQENFRTPHSVARLLDGVLPENLQIQARGPLAGSAVEVLAYQDTQSLRQATTEALTRCLAAGFGRQDIALVSFHGRRNSDILSLAQLGPHRLRSFTGRYDPLGRALYSTGEIVAESVYRFKGQAAAAVVFTEIDFDTLDEPTQRKLFVGATRASMKLVLVASTKAAEKLHPA
jgi:hypothetical protein